MFGTFNKEYNEIKWCESNGGEFDGHMCWDKTKPNTVIFKREKPKPRSADNIIYVD